MKRTSKVLTGLTLSLLSTLAATSARAQDASPPPPYSAEAAPWEARIGYRGSWVENSGYAPFSSNDYMPAFSLAASRLVFARGAFAFTAGAAWDYGSTGAQARGSDASLTVHRLTAPLAMHYRVLRWLDLIATVAPGAQYQGASIQEPSAVAPLVASSWVPCGDASLGVAWGFAHTSIGPVPFIFRLTAEGGYAWAAPMSLAMTPDLPSNSPERVGPTDLGTLAMNGAFGRIGLAVGF
jgi:hypothetical protein